MKKLVKENCSNVKEGTEPNYNGSGDCISRAEAVLASLKKVPQNLLTDKEG